MIAIEKTVSNVSKSVEQRAALGYWKRLRQVFRFFDVSGL